MSLLLFYPTRFRELETEGKFLKSNFPCSFGPETPAKTLGTGIPSEINDESRPRGRGKRESCRSSSLIFAFAVPLATHLALYLGLGASWGEGNQGPLWLHSSPGPFGSCLRRVPQHPLSVPAPVGPPVGGQSRRERTRPGAAPPGGADPRPPLRSPAGERLSLPRSPAARSARALPTAPSSRPPAGGR